MFTSTICDTIARINQAVINKSQFGRCRNSKLNVEILKVLLRLKLIKKYEILDLNNIVYELTFNGDNPLMIKIKIYSLPSKKIYVKNNTILMNKGIYRTAVISTSKGLKTCSQCLKEKLGGEMLFLLQY